MARVKSLKGKIHKYHIGSKYTRCGKRVKLMMVTGSNNPKKRCSACWE